MNVPAKAIITASLGVVLMLSVQQMTSSTQFVSPTMGASIDKKDINNKTDKKLNKEVVTKKKVLKKVVTKKATDAKAIVKKTKVYKVKVDPSNVTGTSSVVDVEKLSRQSHYYLKKLYYY